MVLKGKSMRRSKSQLRTPPEATLKSSSLLNSSSASQARKTADVKGVPSTVSPVLAFSFGLNRIKPRSGRLPQESFLGFKNDNVPAQRSTSSNLSKPGGSGNSGLSSLKSGGKMKEGSNQSKMNFQDHVKTQMDVVNSSENVSSGCSQSRESSPNLPARSRLHNGKSTSEAGCICSIVRECSGSGYSCSHSNDNAYPSSELEDSSDAESLSGSSGLSNRQDEQQ